MDDGAKDGSLRVRNRILRREAIYQSALELFRKRGFDGASMQEIADQAGVSRATVFNYYPNKEQILVDYHREMTTAVLGAKSPNSPGTNGPQAILNLMRRFADWTEADAAMGRVFIPRMFTSVVLLGQDARDEADLADWITVAVERGKAEGEFRPQLEVAVFVPLLIGALSSTVLDWVLSDSSQSLWPQLKPRIDFLLDSAKAGGK